MIIDAIVGAILGAVRAVIALFPTWQPDVAGVTGTAEAIGQWAGMLNAYFPVGALFGVLMFIIGLRLVLIVVRLLTRVWELLPLT